MVIKLPRSRRRRCRGGRHRGRIASWTDPLTGAWNRRWLSSLRAGRRAAAGGPWSAILIDVDGLGRVNDRLGYGEGDRVLAGVARVLKAVADVRGRLVRLGGDEFLVPISGSVPAEVQRIAECAVAAIGTVKLRGRSRIRASAGIAVARARGSPGWDQLIEAAYRALKAAKRAGGGGVRWTWA